GQWIADQLGFGPLLPAQEIVQALRSLQSRNFRSVQGAGNLPVPLALAGGSNGTAGTTEPGGVPPSAPLGKGGLAVSQRPPEAGVAILQSLDAVLNNRLKSPWQSPLAFRMDTAQSLMPDLASLTHAADWSALNALEGFTIDLSAGQLVLSPQIPGT